MSLTRCITVLVTLAIVSPPLRAEGPESAGPHSEKTTGEPRPSTPRPLGPAEIAKVGAGAAKVWPAVMVIGHPEHGHGTGFIISRQHRLIATAAHVADHFFQDGSLMAVCNGGMTVYRVERAWYHPEMLRDLDDGFAVRSPDPSDGPVSFDGLDIAVLRLADDGLPLPAEAEMAGGEELDRMIDAPVGLLGYSGRDGPIFGESPASASLQFGRVIGLNALASGPDRSPEARRIVKHTAPGGAGTSGGPIFLPNGHIAAIHYASNSSGHWKAVRIDALLELIAYHGLDRLIPIPGGRGRIRVPRGPDRDPKLPQYCEAVRLVKKAKWLTARRDFKGAGECCNRAIRLAPEYGGAYVRRFIVRVHYIGDQLGKAGDDEYQRQGLFENIDIDKLAKLDYTNDELVYGLFQSSLYYLVLGRAKLDPGEYRKRLQSLLGDVQKMLDAELGDVGRSRFLSLGAQLKDLLGDPNQALDDYGEAIRLSPEDDVIYCNRARLRERLGRTDLAAEDRAMRDQLQRRWSSIPPEIDRPAVASSLAADSTPPGPPAIPELPAEPSGSPFDFPVQATPTGPNPTSAHGAPR